MNGITLERAQKHLEAWLDAELAVTTGQSYKLSDRELTRANLREIQQQVKFWDTKVKQLMNKGRSRVRRAVPRDW